MINKPFEDFSNQIFNKEKNFVEINRKINNKNNFNRLISKCFILVMISIISIGFIDYKNIKLIEKEVTEYEGNTKEVINFNLIDKNDSIFMEDINSRK